MIKLRKIPAVILGGLMVFSQVAFAENAHTTDKANDDIAYVISVSEGLARSSVQFDGSKKKEIIEVNLKQDKMLYNALDVPCMIQTGFGANAEYAIADGKNNTPYQTLRTLITGTEIIPVQKYDEEYMSEIKKFMENGEYYDEIAADVGRYRNYDGSDIKYTFEIISVELNEDATEVTVNTKITPENSSEDIKYLALNYKKVDGKWKF